MAVKKRRVARRAPVMEFVAEASPFKGYWNTSHAAKEIHEISTGLAKRHNVSGSALDVGPGSNKEVMRSLKKLGVDTHSINVQAPNGRLRQGKKVSLIKKDRIGKHYFGNIVHMHSNKSELKDKKFDYFTFWGSMNTGIGAFHGLDNFSVEEMARAIQGGDMSPQEEKDLGMHTREATLRSCRYALNPGGKIAVVSSRFSFHGGRPDVAGLPDEIARLKRIMKQMDSLNPKKLTVYVKDWDWARGTDGEFRECIKKVVDRWSRIKSHRKTRSRVIKAIKGYVNHDEVDVNQFTTTLNHCGWGALAIHEIFGYAQGLRGLRQLEQRGELYPVIDGIVAEF